MTGEWWIVRFLASTSVGIREGKDAVSNNSEQPEGDHGISKVLIVDKSVKKDDREVATDENDSVVESCKRPKKGRETDK